jgi:hypothetical protein
MPSYSVIVNEKKVSARRHEIQEEEEEQLRKDRQVGRTLLALYISNT